MTDKIQKIKDWISKTQDGLMDANGNFENPSNEGAFHILSNLDYYIDSLQEEPVKRTPADIEAAMQEVEDKSRVFTEAHKGEDADTVLAQMRGEEPVSEDLGDYINKLSKQFPEVSFAKLSRIAVRVAKWQKEQKMAKAIDVEVKGDAGGYPYIPQMELYDYDKDVPLAKAGDRYKVILIKEG